MILVIKRTNDIYKFFHYEDSLSQKLFSKLQYCSSSGPVQLSLSQFIRSKNTSSSLFSSLSDIPPTFAYLLFVKYMSCENFVATVNAVMISLCMLYESRINFGMLVCSPDALLSGCESLSKYTRRDRYTSFDVAQ